jgi:hypothetical protein
MGTLSMMPQGFCALLTSRLPRLPEKELLKRLSGCSSSELVLLSASFGLFAPHNNMAAPVLTLSALAVAGAVAMFLELEQGFGQVIRISPEPMQKTARSLQVDQRASNAP